MSVNRLLWNYFDRLDSFLHRGRFGSTARGQALVEFVLVFLLFLVVVWISTDFGLVFYIGQLVLNAFCEGARIAAADANPTSGTCTLPCSGAPVGSVLHETVSR